MRNTFIGYYRPSDEPLKEDFVITFEEWCEKMEKLLDKLRNSSLKINQSNKAI